jgi:hypothetical protein
MNSVNACAHTPNTPRAGPTLAHLRFGGRTGSLVVMVGSDSIGSGFVLTQLMRRTHPGSCALHNEELQDVPVSHKHRLRGRWLGLPADGQVHAMGQG